MVQTWQQQYRWATWVVQGQDSLTSMR